MTTAGLALSVSFINHLQRFKVNYLRKNTHFFSKRQSGDDITGCYCEILREINSTALIVHQNLGSKQTLLYQGYVRTLEIPQSLVCSLELGLYFFVPLSDTAPVSQSHHAKIAGSNAARHCGRGDDVPSTPRYNPPERCYAHLQKQYHLIQGKRGHTEVQSLHHQHSEGNQNVIHLCTKLASRQSQTISSPMLLL